MPPGSTWGRERLVHLVRSGEVLGLIAQNYRVRIGDIRKWNGLSGNLIRVGQKLSIWVPGRNLKPNSTRSVASTIATTQSSSPKGAKIYYVKPGDTLRDISRMYQNLSVDKIKALNNLKTNRIDPGQALVIG